MDLPETWTGHDYDIQQLETASYILMVCFLIDLNLIQMLKWQNWGKIDISVMGFRAFPSFMIYFHHRYSPFMVIL